jgi:imidazolonepropionase-like amidohydrolase
MMVAAIAGCGSEPPADPKTVPTVITAVPYEPDSGTVAVRCGALIDGVAEEARPATTVLIVNGRFNAVAAQFEVPQGTPQLDLSGYTCLPGLIDMHTHLTDRPGDTADLSQFYRRTPEEQAVISADNARATVLAGFTTVRNVGTYIAWSDRDLRDRINAGDVIGPRMQIVGYYLTIPGGGGDLVIPRIPESQIPPYIRMGVARGPEEFRRKAEAALAGGADFLKVIASGAVLAYGGVPGAPEMTSEEIAAVVKVARTANKKVAAHAHGAQSIKDAILAGVDTIEHASLIDEEGIASAGSHRVALVMDIYNGDYFEEVGRREGWPAEFLRKNLETTEPQRQGFRKAHAAGAVIVFGTDAGVYPHGLNARQFALMVKWGMSPMAAIKAATSVAARYMVWEDRVGSIAPGRFGDLIAVEGDPLRDVTVLENVAVVIKGGLLFKSPPG